MIINLAEKSDNEIIEETIREPETPIKPVDTVIVNPQIEFIKLIGHYSLLTRILNFLS